MPDTPPDAAEPLAGARGTYRGASAGLSAAAVRSWALGEGMNLSLTGGLPRFVYELYRESHSVTQT